MKKLALILAAAAAVAPAVRGAEPRPVFPVPFVVEHHTVRSEPGGEELVSETVTDTYGGSFLVSVRPGGSRTIVDFARREMTEVDSAKGTYWTLGFGRMQELRDRVARAQRPQDRPRTARPAALPEIRLEELPAGREATRPGGRLATRHLRASAEGAPGLEVWVDASVTLKPEALEALRAFESEALGSDAAAGRTPGELLHAVRLRAAGAFPVRTRRALGSDDARAAVLEDVVTRLETVPAFPEKLVTLGPGFRRVPSPLEIVAAFEDEEAARTSRAPR